jgi:uncharacterized membrane protein
LKYFRKIRDSREPPGMEWVVLRKLPMYFAGGTLVPIIVSALSHLFPPAGTPGEIVKQTRIVDYLALGFGMTVWTAVLTVAIGCLVVIVMKGPHYAADSYYLDGSHMKEHEPEKPQEEQMENPGNK